MLDFLDKVEHYYGDMARLCPYLRRSFDAGEMETKAELISGANAYRATEEVYTKCFRAALDTISRGRDGQTYPCTNIFLILPVGLQEEQSTNAILSIAHSLLRTTFTSHSLLFGKFWENQDVQMGKYAPPPAPFISIRQGVEVRDERFFLDCDHMLPEFRSSFSNWSALPDLPVGLQLTQLIWNEVSRAQSDRVAKLS
ncbi:hypothetical protein PsAD2_03420 [Pseudovibrio axinellae]|uniref:DUF6875 domain-containing protein n=1 Tax=Pseudovibrio axinellae TaxID=989403 RepID=A0A165WJF5_9HYPH|nr:hypothetical protein [Pseudovibrio axinellae]KZL16601.1 hypothetical protein PsAD2_03420 [Pseudovibrio axinellae]SER91315.1 hypothetical protein SAMN05421798_1591 [Pseudovibrio axinellae]